MDEKHLDKDAAYKMFAAFLSGSSAAIALLVKTLESAEVLRRGRYEANLRSTISDETNKINDGAKVLLKLLLEQLEADDDAPEPSPGRIRLRVLH